MVATYSPISDMDVDVATDMASDVDNYDDVVVEWLLTCLVPMTWLLTWLMMRQMPMMLRGC